MRNHQLPQRPFSLLTVTGASAVAVALALGGCSSDSDSGKDDDKEAAASTGQFGGLPVTGLRYETETESGATDGAGTFRYREGETVAFSIGALELGTAQGAGRLTVQHLVENADSLEDPGVTNRAAFLQTLDQDGDLNNWIQITEQTAELVGMAVPEDETIPVQTTLETQEAEGQRFVESLGLDSEADVLAALRQTPWTELVQAANETGFAARPNIDGWYKTLGIREAFETGAHHDVPIMAGANSGDYPSLIGGLKWNMPWMAEANQSDVFAYMFDHVPAGWRTEGVPSYHGIELVYVFDYTGSFVAHYLLGLSEHEAPAPQKFAQWTTPGWTRPNMLRSAVLPWTCGPPSPGTATPACRTRAGPLTRRPTTPTYGLA